MFMFIFWSWNLYCNTLWQGNLNTIHTYSTKIVYVIVGGDHCCDYWLGFIKSKHLLLSLHRYSCCHFIKVYFDIKGVLSFLFFCCQKPLKQCAYHRCLDAKQLSHAIAQLWSTVDLQLYLKVSELGIRARSW